MEEAVTRLKAVMETPGCLFPMGLSVSGGFLTDRQPSSGMGCGLPQGQPEAAAFAVLTSTLEAATRKPGSFVQVVGNDLRAPLLNIHGFSREPAETCVHRQALVAEAMPPAIKAVIAGVPASLEHQVRATGATGVAGALPGCRADKVHSTQVFRQLNDIAVNYRHPPRPLQIAIHGRISTSAAPPSA